jgi:hypothetical protein
MVYFLLVWFFIASFSKEQWKVNVVMFAMYLFNTWWFEPIGFHYLSVEYKEQFILNKEHLVKIDVVFCLIMLATNYNKLNPYLFKQWSLLSFAVLCHFMILYDLTVSQSLITGLFYTFYDELIIIVGLLQVCISSGGIMGLFRKLQSFDYRILLSGILYRKSLPERKTRKVKS